MNVIELCEGRIPITIRPDDDLALALQTMLWGEVRHLPVLEGDKLIGVLSERDVLFHGAAAKKGEARLKVRAAMSQPPVTVAPSDDVTMAARLMLDRGIGCLPVVEHNALVGIVTKTDILRLEVGEVPGATHGPTLTDVMKKKPATAATDDYLLDAVGRMESLNVRHMPVVDGDRKVVGMLSDRDVRTAIGNTLRPLRPGDAAVRIEITRVGDVMGHIPLTVQRSVTLAEVAGRLVDHRVGAVPVVDEDRRLIGIVSYVDVLRALVPR